MKIVFLDKLTIGKDMDFTAFHKMGEVAEYDLSAPEDVPDRVEDADVIIVNKVPVNGQTIYTAGKLKLVCVAATGTNNLDKEYLSKRGITWRNVAGYSTETVVQHTFSMLFYLLEHLRYYDDYVREGHYVNDIMFTHFAETFHQLSGQTWGIIGLGAIGRRVADIAKIFGVNVIYYSASGAPPQPGYVQVDLDTLLGNSDIISVHAPLNEHTEGLMGEKAFRKMKRHAVFLNLGRGPIVSEKALADALNEGQIAAAGLDVLVEEPMSEENSLLGVRDKNRLLITPHIAWTSVEARTKLVQIIADQIADFFGKE